MLYFYKISFTLVTFKILRWSHIVFFWQTWHKNTFILRSLRILWILWILRILRHRFYLLHSKFIFYKLTQWNNFIKIFLIENKIFMYKEVCVCVCDIVWEDIIMCDRLILRWFWLIPASSPQALASSVGGRAALFTRASTQHVFIGFASKIVSVSICFCYTQQHCLRSEFTYFATDIYVHLYVWVYIFYSMEHVYFLGFILYLWIYFTSCHK